MVPKYSADPDPQMDPSTSHSRTSLLGKQSRPLAYMS